MMMKRSQLRGLAGAKTGSSCPWASHLLWQRKPFLKRQLPRSLAGWPSQALSNGR